uniref:RING-type domain-containing protein n=1 Tax=Pyrodinium bahamense TaxID=73915 RepID=A0A7S0B7J9_9DINO|mmetsp:Transcript_53059/g.147036  ORF Transcript_53059/g.147036 Transcript_53059/m.147036 type:complete len:283 (+) Transcript_53059:53-901(+)
MDPAVISRTLRLLQVCLAETSLEIIVVIVFIWMLPPGECIAYPIFTVFLNMLRWWITADLVCGMLRTQRDAQTLGDQMLHTELLNPWMLQLWYVMMIALCVWFSTVVSRPHGCDGWVTYTVVTMTATFVPIGIVSLSVFGASPEAEGPRTLVKTFKHHSQAGPDLPLQFGINCLICCSDVVEGHSVGQLPCGHAFHETCIRRWLEERDCCPLRCGEAATNRAVHGAAAEGSFDALLAAADAAWSAAEVAAAEQGRPRARPGVRQRAGRGSEAGAIGDPTTRL